MRTILILILTLLSISALANDICYEFGVRKYSPGLQKLIARTPTVVSSEIRGITLSGVAKNGNKVSVHFRCGNERLCVDDNGAGEFKFLLKKNSEILNLEFEYINLEISQAPEDNGQRSSEIGEEFAIFDLNEKNDDEDDGGPAKLISIDGAKSVCE